MSFRTQETYLGSYFFLYRKRVMVVCIERLVISRQDARIMLAWILPCICNVESLSDYFIYSQQNLGNCNYLI